MNKLASITHRFSCDFSRSVITISINIIKIIIFPLLVTLLMHQNKAIFVSKKRSYATTILITFYLPLPIYFIQKIHFYKLLHCVHFGSKLGDLISLSTKFHPI